MEATLFAFIPEAAGAISAVVAMLVVLGVLATVYVAAPGERGERARFAELLSRLTDYAKGVRLVGLAALHKKALRLKIPHPDAWDVAQDVAMEAWRSFPTYDPNRGEFASWINGIALNVASDWHKSARAREKPIPPDPAGEAERRAALSPDARHELANHRQDIAALVLALPAGARWLLLRGVKRTSMRTGIPWSTPAPGRRARG